MIQRIRSGRYATQEFDPFDSFVEFDNPEWKHPLEQHVPKRRFVPSHWERLKINKFALAIKKGWMKTLAEKAQEEEEQEKLKDKTWDIWADETIEVWRPRRMPKAIAAPKRDLPIHAESYNPPPEYLWDDKEKEQQMALDA